MLLDEPTTHLDENNAAGWLVKELKKIARTENHRFTRPPFYRPDCRWKSGRSNAFAKSTPGTSPNTKRYRSTTSSGSRMNMTSILPGSRWKMGSNKENQGKICKQIQKQTRFRFQADGRQTLLQLKAEKTRSGRHRDEIRLRQLEQKEKPYQG